MAGVGGRYDAASHQTRQTVGVGGRCDSGQILLTEHPSYLPYKDICLRKQTGGRQRGHDAHSNLQIHPRAHQQRCIKAFGFYRSASSACTFIFVGFYCLCVCVCACSKVCLIVQPQHNLLTARMATEGRKSDTWEPRRGPRSLGCSLRAPRAGEEAHS